jgi:hypothetical protein
MWMTPQDTTSLRMSEWTSMGDFFTLNTSSKSTAYSHRVTPQKRSFVRGFLDVLTILLSSSHAVHSRDTHNDIH